MDPYQQQQQWQGQQGYPQQFQQQQQQGGWGQQQGGAWGQQQGGQNWNMQQGQGGAWGQQQGGQGQQNWNMQQGGQGQQNWNAQAAQGQGGEDWGEGGDWAGEEQQGGAKKKKDTSEMTLDEYNAYKKEKKAADLAARKKKAEEAARKGAEEAKAKKAAAAAGAAAPAAEGANGTTADFKPAERAESPKAAPKSKDPSPDTAASSGKPADDDDAADWDDDDSPVKKANGASPKEKSAEKKTLQPSPRQVENEKEAEKPKKEAKKEAIESPADSVAGSEIPVEKSKASADATAPDSRQHFNVVFIGHVDAGKSTTCGNILYLGGGVDERAIEKYQREAKEKNRDSWFLAYIMDTSEEEKAKGKTVEVGRAHFETAHKRFTILDAPGHKSYVPNMISGASQADVGVLIVSARKGEFETGFEKGGQTGEHALLARTLGVGKLVIAINKMDDPSVGWKKERYDEIEGKIRPFLKTSCGFRDADVCFLPISGLAGDNIKERKGAPSWVVNDIDVCPAWEALPKSPTLFELFDALEQSEEMRAGDSKPLRVPMLDGYRDEGKVTAIGKIEQGVARAGQKCLIQPVGKPCTITAVYINDKEVTHANVGENCTFGIGGGATEQDLRKGYVLSPLKDPARAVNKVKVQFKVLELIESCPVLTAGYRCVIHFHTAIENAEIAKLVEVVRARKPGAKKGTKPVTEKNPKFAKTGDTLTCVINFERPSCVDSVASCQKLGRFTLRDEGLTVGIGKILNMPDEKKDKK